MKPKVNLEKVMMILFVLFFLATIISAADSDFDGIPDSDDKYPNDYDNDGMPDTWEKQNGLRYDFKDADRDPDEDGLTNLQEYESNTDPLNPDKKELLGLTAIFSPLGENLVKILLWSGVAFIFFLVLGIVIFKLRRSKKHPKAHPKKIKHKVQNIPKHKVQSMPNLPRLPSKRYPALRRHYVYQQQPIKQQPHTDEYISIEELSKQLDPSPTDKLRRDYAKMSGDDVFDKLNEYSSNYKAKRRSKDLEIFR